MKLLSHRRLDDEVRLDNLGEDFVAPSKMRGGGDSLFQGSLAYLNASNFPRRVSFSLERQWGVNNDQNRNKSFVSGGARCSADFRLRTLVVSVIPTPAVHCGARWTQPNRGSSSHRVKLNFFKEKRKSFFHWCNRNTQEAPTTLEHFYSAARGGEIIRK